jgi:hypothetical protein
MTLGRWLAQRRQKDPAAIDRRVPAAGDELWKSLVYVPG